MSAPVLCISFLIIGGLVTWIFYRREMATSKERFALANERAQVAEKKAFETDEAIRLLSQQVADGALPIEIAATVASVGVSVEELMRAQRRVSETIQTSTSSGVIIRPDVL
jgi:antitoxin component of RelBE/YafQ-DinJ toxin-antitoxin module